LHPQTSWPSRYQHCGWHAIRLRVPACLAAKRCDDTQDGTPRFCETSGGPPAVRAAEAEDVSNPTVRK
jgi:hypothetical protein